MSFGFAWIARKSTSAWPAALAHGANNTIGAAFLLTPKTWSVDTLTELASMAMVAAGFVWAALRRERTDRGAGEARLVESPRRSGSLSTMGQMRGHHVATLALRWKRASVSALLRR